MKFYKYQGTGNDFILVDNRNHEYDGLTEEVIKRCCDRRFGIGADGFMMLNSSTEYDFEMVYYNADGKEGSMCGNGGRCITQFAYDTGMVKTNFNFLAVDGPHESAIYDPGVVSLKMRDVKEISKYHGDSTVNTGSPHLVKNVDDVSKVDVVKEGRKIRYNNDFNEAGINVNFVEVKDDNNLVVRTYERGVEDETFSCGTGVTASALVYFHNENGFNEVYIDTPGGQLTVRFRRNTDGTYERIWLKGPAVKVFEGTIDLNI
jgi:diaminopimelate epimerase